MGNNVRIGSHVMLDPLLDYTQGNHSKGRIFTSLASHYVEGDVQHSSSHDGWYVVFRSGDTGWFKSKELIVIRASTEEQQGIGDSQTQTDFQTS